MRKTLSAFLVTAFMAASPVWAQDIKTQELGDGFYMLVGPGGNIGVSSGEDGLFVIDDKFERNGKEIIERLGEISDAPLRFVLNTHYHGDHTGSNAVMKTTDATIMAHENVRTRMGMRFENKAFNRITEPTDPSLWPDLTYSEDATLHLNGQTIKAIHTPRAHTDGDSIVYFEEGNVLHMGDNFFNGMFPYIDVSGGGSIKGMIASHDRALALADENTKIIPGHGPLATKADLKRHRDMLQTVMLRVQAGVDKGQSAADLVKVKPLADLSEFDGGFINAERMITLTHWSLSEG